MGAENNRNGYGYSITQAGVNAETADVLFGHDADAIMHDAVAAGSCLVEGSVGAGKSHLAHDLGILARSAEFEIPTFSLRAHINGGSKKGIRETIRCLDVFADDYRSDGLIIVDNADYYGYSRTDVSRQPSLAREHLRVAKHMMDLVDDSDAPIMVGIAHEPEWRKLHWRYSTKKGIRDDITPVAEEYLDSFSARYLFRGQLDSSIAELLLFTKGQFTHDEARHLTQELEDREALAFRIVSRLRKPDVNKIGLTEIIESINTGTARRMGQLATAS